VAKTCRRVVQKEKLISKFALKTEYFSVYELIKKIYEPKFSSACTKSEAILTNVLSPYILGEVTEDLNKPKSITVSLDASNKKTSNFF
jgi:hypothetical protein